MCQRFIFPIGGGVILGGFRYRSPLVFEVTNPKKINVGYIEEEQKTKSQGKRWGKVKIEKRTKTLDLSSSSLLNLFPESIYISLSISIYTVPYPPSLPSPPSQPLTWPTASYPPYPYNHEEEKTYNIISLLLPLYIFKMNKCMCPFHHSFYSYNFYFSLYFLFYIPLLYLSISYPPPPYTFVSISPVYIYLYPTPPPPPSL